MRRREGEGARPERTRGPGGSSRRPAEVPAQSEQQRPPHPHVCTSCGRACRPCAEAARSGHPLPHTIRTPWCAFCTSVYRDNAPAEDGRVHCGGSEWSEGEGCGGALPTLAVLIERGLQRYPRLCGKCRAERAAEEAEFRANDAAIGVGRVVAGAAPRPVPDPLADRPRGRPAAPRRGLDTGAPTVDTERARAENWARGGFVPRPGPELTESEHGDGETEWPGAPWGR